MNKNCSCQSRKQQACFTTWGKNTTFEYKQAMKEEMLATSDVQTKFKQLSITGALTNCTTYDRDSRQWMEITNMVTWLKLEAKSLRQDTTWQVENIFQYDNMVYDSENLYCYLSYY